MRHLAGKQVAVLLTLAGIVRLGAAAYWQIHWHGQFVFGDSHGYFELARTIAHGQPYQLPSGEQVFRTPGYPLVLAPVLWLFDGASAIWAARVEGCLFGALTVLAVAWWAGLLFGRRAAWIAGLITALYPEAVAISVPVLSESPFCLLVALNMAFWTMAWKHRTHHAPQEEYLIALLIGAITAAATLVRPSWMLFLPLAIGSGMICGPYGGQVLFVARKAAGMLRMPSAARPQAMAKPSFRSRELRADGTRSVPATVAEGTRSVPATFMLAGFIVVMLPWWVRNYRVTGHFVPTTLQVGASLYDGWNPHATGASDMRFVPQFEAALREADKDNVAKPAAADSFEYRLNRRFRAAAWEWARAHPVRVLRLAGVKFLRIWNVWPNEPSFAAWPVRLAVLVTYVPLMLLAALGTWHFRRVGWPIVLCWLPAVYFTLLHTVFVSSIRYRQPALLGLIVLAAAYLAKPTAGPSDPGEPA